MSADYQVHGDVAVITLNNPPVNGLGLSTRRAVVQGLEKAQADEQVKAIVITGAGGAFSGGADITEFGTDRALAEPNLHSVIAAVEQSAKPVVAAIHSVCMGGGLELALACHYRVAAPGCNVALPEVKLGLLPGAGGTQRSPRLMGAVAAAELMLSGKHLSAKAAQAAGLVDRLAEGDDPTAAGLAYARELLASGAGVRRTNSHAPNHSTRSVRPRPAAPGDPIGEPDETYRFHRPRAGRSRHRRPRDLHRRRRRPAAGAGAVSRSDVEQ